jgi:hypothetical protein
MGVFLDFSLIVMGCYLIGSEYSTALGWGLWFICTAFYRSEL